MVEGQSAEFSRKRELRKYEVHTEFNGRALSLVVQEKNEKKTLNCPPWLEKRLISIHLKWLNMRLKLSTMIGEKFDFYSPRMDKNALKLSIMVGENSISIHIKWLEIYLKLSTRVGENFRFYSSQMAGNTLRVVDHG